MTKMVVIDSENNAEEWWGAARTRLANADNEPELADMTDAARQTLERILETGEDYIQVTDEVAKEIEFWASGLVGWDDGPEHAPTALIIQDA